MLLLILSSRLEIPPADLSTLEIHLNIDFILRKCDRDDINTGTASLQDRSKASADQASETEASPAKGDDNILDDPSRRYL